MCVHFGSMKFWTKVLENLIFIFQRSNQYCVGESTYLYMAKVDLD